MLKNLFVSTLIVAAAAGVVSADQSPSRTLVIPVHHVPTDNGKLMYMSYCAPCHGVDGRGQGPVASALKQQPTDLTLLSKNNGGRFPAIHVISVLKFGTSNLAHGTAQMPVWGQTLSKVDSAVSQSDVGELRIRNLSQYMQSLQQK